jgi:AAA+ superfamily predicted ATPase
VARRVETHDRAEADPASTTGPARSWHDGRVKLEEKPAVLRVPPDADVVRELEILVRARHPLLHVASHEEERVGVLLDHLADRLGAQRFDWAAHRGLFDVRGGAPVKDSTDPAAALAWIGQLGAPFVAHFRGFGHHLGTEAVAAQVRELHLAQLSTRNLVVFTDEAELPKSLAGLITHFALAPLGTADYHRLVNAILRDLRQRAHVDVALTPEEVHDLLEELKGLTLFEVQKVVTEAVVEDRRLDAKDLPRIRQAKMRSVQRSGVLEYTPAASTLADVAGLARLKEWIRKRGTALRDPVAARRFGVEPPRGLLLLGVQGCGKSLCAKAVASELAMPLVRLDPSSVYNKYFGESEKNLARAIRLAEAMAPVVLWIDELEKAFASVADGGNDGGVSHRLFGTFLTWLSEKKETVFVVATANDVSRLPPELVRKGRFDEIFFVDLPGAEARRAVLTLHLRRRGQDPDTFELAPLVAASEGFSGAELEQVVVASLYTAFHEKRPLDAAMIAAEIGATVPLSRTMSEKITGLRAWARDRAVPAD